MENGDRSVASRIRQYCSVGILAMAMLLSITSVTHAASSFYWYGENNSTCWQTGQLGSPNKECSTVGAGYLATPGGHTGGLAYMSEGGAGTDLTTLSSSGDFCSYYRLGDQLTSQDSTNEGATTGISMPTPYSSYQEGDKTSSAYNACQADGSYWGQAVRGPSGGGCSATCGMHHYVSFRGQGTNDRPWSVAFGAPSLVLSAEAGVYTFSHTGTNYRGWGYVCPELEDTSSHGVLEYCFQEWRSANDPPEWKNERKGECSSPYSQVNTYFWPGTSYATEMPGSTNTFEVGSPGSGHFEAKITEANLKNAARLINAECAGWHLSENPSNYALVGVEQGLEGELGISAIGGWGANLQLRSEYMPPPKATTGTASEIGEEQTTLNGNVNPEGSDTHYYFQYGTTTAYGSSAPTPPGNDAGSGTSTLSKSATATNLEPGTTYHYRLVASNVGGTTYGGDQTVVTAGHQGVALAVQGPTNTLDYYENYVNEPWTKIVLGGEGSTYGTPSMVRFKDRFGIGMQLVVQGPNHTLDFYAKYDGEPWTKTVIGGEGSTYGTPSLVRFSDKYGTGLQLVVEGSSHTLDFYTNYDGEPWTKAVIGGENSTYGTPSLVRFSDKYGTGLQLTVQGPGHTLDFYGNYDGEPWTKAVIGSEGSTYGTPSMVRFNDRYGTGLQLSVEGVSHTLDFYTNYDGEPWTKAVIGTENSTSGTPSMVRFNDKYGTGLQLAVQGPGHTLDFYGNYDGEPWTKVVIGTENSTSGNPSIVRFSDYAGTGLQLVVEGSSHTLDFYTDYDGEPWIKAVIGSENTTYGTPSMVELHAPNGAFEL